ncbi:MAG: NUDIX hydrolase [Hyphomicrobiaceae bacterium]
MHRIGIIPFDFRDDAIALLFVTSQTRGRWILPKGKPKLGETHVQTCHREGFEEAGIHGIVLEDFATTVPIGKKTPEGIQKFPVTYYPYLVLNQANEWPEMKKRQRHWALIEDASKVAYRVDYLALIQHFESMRPWIIEAARNHKSALREELSPAP